MDNKDKLRVILKHWIDHNGGHVEEFAKWKQLMTDEQDTETATALDQAMQQMNKVSDILQKTLDGLGGAVESGDHHHHHHHHHK